MTLVCPLPCANTSYRTKSHFGSRHLGPSVAAEFFIDNVPQPLHDLAAHTYSFPVSAGTHTFLWLHHQDQETLRGDIRVDLLFSLLLNSLLQLMLTQIKSCNRPQSPISRSSAHLPVVTWPTIVLLVMQAPVAPTRVPSALLVLTAALPSLHRQVHSLY